MFNLCLICSSTLIVNPRGADIGYFMLLWAWCPLIGQKLIKGQQGSLGKESVSCVRCNCCQAAGVAQQYILLHHTVFSPKCKNKLKFNSSEFRLKCCAQKLWKCDKCFVILVLFFVQSCRVKLQRKKMSVNVTGSLGRAVLCVDNDRQRAEQRLRSIC